MKRKVCRKVTEDMPIQKKMEKGMLLSFSIFFVYLTGNGELLHLPSIIRHQQFLEIVIFLLAFDFFNLFY